MNLENEKETRELGALLLEIGALLMSSGASTARVRITTDRIAGVFGFNADLFVTHRALTLSLSNDKNEQLFNSLKRTSPHGVNFKLVSGISRMSWRIVEENWTIEQIRTDLMRLQSLPH